MFLPGPDPDPLKKCGSRSGSGPIKSPTLLPKARLIVMELNMVTVATRFLYKMDLKELKLFKFIYHPPDPHEHFCPDPDPDLHQNIAEPKH